MTITLDPRDAEFFGDIESLSKQIGNVGVNKSKGRLEMLGALQRVVKQFVDKYGVNDSTLSDGKKVAAELGEHYEKLYQNLFPSLSCGIPKLDELIGGICPQRVYLFAARPGHGKTAMIVSMKRAHLDLGMSVYIASAEMSRLSLGERLVAQYSHIPVSAQKPGISRSQFERLFEAANKIAETMLFVNDSSGLTIEQMDRDLKYLSDNDQRAEVCYIDYVQLLKSEITDNRASSVEKLTYISNEVLNLSKKHDIPIIAAVQENRDSEKRVSFDAKLSDIKGAGQFEQDAHFVAHIKNEVPEAGSDRIIRENDFGKPVLYKAQIKINKNRTGPKGEVSLLYNAPMMEFGDLYD